jgi:hypothetical protein
MREMKDLPGLEIKGVITILVALVGAVLGVMNTVNAMNRTR